MIGGQFGGNGMRFANPPHPCVGPAQRKKGKGTVWLKCQCGLGSRRCTRVMSLIVLKQSEIIPVYKREGIQCYCLFQRSEAPLWKSESLIIELQPPQGENVV